MPAPEYDAGFFAGQRTDSQRSAAVVVPLVRELVEFSSVLDLGCGTGDWLSVCQALGVRDLVGMDGDWVDRASLSIPADAFRPADLARPIAHARRYDLAMSVEVGEHLPAAAAATLVASLADAADVVLFSAAVPGQGGTHHVNEQWPAYWARLFDAHGFVSIDCLRPRLWADERVAWYYAQNLVLYARPSAIARWPRLAAERRPAATLPLALVHPTLLERERAWADRARAMPSVRTAAGQLARSVARVVRGG